MHWDKIRETYPSRWLVIEALQAHTQDEQRLLDKLAVVEECADGLAAFRRYHALHQQFPEREFYFVHTARAKLEIIERHWLGVRRGHATQPAR